MSKLSSKLVTPSMAHVWVSHDEIGSRTRNDRFCYNQIRFITKHHSIMADSILNVCIFRVCIYSVIPTGSDYNVTTLNVMMGAGETRAMFSVGIVDDEVVERRESFQCTVSRINSPLQDIPIEWDQVPATVIIEDDDYYMSVFLRNYSSQVSENVSHVPITILSHSMAAFEYTVDLYVENGGTAEGMLQSPVCKALHLFYLSTLFFIRPLIKSVCIQLMYIPFLELLMINQSFVCSYMLNFHCNSLLSC